MKTAMRGAGGSPGKSMGCYQKNGEQMLNKQEKRRPAITPGLRTQRREECGLYFTSLPSLALDLKFHTTEPNTSSKRIKPRHEHSCVLSPRSPSREPPNMRTPSSGGNRGANKEDEVEKLGCEGAWTESQCGKGTENTGEIEVEVLNVESKNRKLCLAADKLFQCPWDLQDVWNEERRTSQELSRGPQKNVLCRRRVFPIRQTVLQPWLPKRGNPGLLFSGPECSCILPFLCFLSRYLLMVHARGLGKLSV
nr:uncharacterized protein LOC129478600 [Symphalangus syndactylus]